MNYEYLINAKRIDCPKCNGEYLVRYGLTNDGRQIVKCKDCNKKSTINPKIVGQGHSNKDKILPFLLKPFYKLNNEELYCLGLLFSKGYVSKTNVLSLSVNKEDKKLLEIFKTVLQIPNPIRIIDRSDGKKGINYILSWGCKYAETDLIRFGLYNKAKNREVWLQYMNSYDFIRGLFDGKGDFGFSPYNKTRIKNKHSAYYSYNNKIFIEKLQKYLLTTANINSNIYNNSKQVGFTLTFDNEEAEKLGDFLYKDSEGLRLERKYQKYLEIKNRHNK